MNILKMIGRDYPLITDMNDLDESIKIEVRNSRFLVIGGAGSIGQAVTKELFSRNPRKLHVVDISENNLVELVRDIRSTIGYIDGDFKTFALDCGSREFEVYFSNEGPFDYVLNLSALKHVRSEKDPYTLMRMVNVNILNTIKTIELAIQAGVKKYFCVSTDKAANPVNMMGASKRIMEMFLLSYGDKINISTARFANVAFSDGSLLHGFQQRLLKNQPIAAPSDVRRYFVTPKESGEICLISALLGKNQEIFFPKLDGSLNLITFSDIAREFLLQSGYQAVECTSEDDARIMVDDLKGQGKWPCFFSESDTTGEKDFEEFYMEGELVDFKRFKSLGIVINSARIEKLKLEHFLQSIKAINNNSKWSKQEILSLFVNLLPEFSHIEKDKFLDSKM